MKKKIIALIYIISIISLSCSQKNNDKVVINFWAMGVEGEYVSRLVPEFEKENPNVKVIVQQIPWTAAHEKLITAFASETLPDAFQLGNTWVPEFNSLSTIQPLDSLVNSSSIINKKNYFSGIWDTNVLDSTIYGIPWYVDTRVLFYRKDILKEAGYTNAPKTWDELYQMSKSIKNLPKYSKTFPFFIPTNEWLPFILFGVQNGADLLKDNNTYGNFSGKEFTQAYSFLMKFYREGLAPTDLQQVLNLYQAFGEGYFTFYITGPWNVTEMKNRFPKELQNEWMTAPLPSPDSTYPGKSLAGGASLVLNKFSKSKKEAWKFIEFLSRADIQLKFYNLVSSLPALKSVWQDSTFTSNKYMNAFYVQLNNTVPTPKIPEWEQIVFSKIQQYAEQTARNKKEISKALKELDSDVNKILEKRRWMLGKE